MAATHNRYHNISIALHWLMFLLLAAVYFFMEFRVIYEKGSAPREMMKEWHFMLGLTVLFLVLARIAARIAYAKPPIVPPLGNVHRFAAGAMHILLYAFMIGMPLAGWMILSASGKSVPFYGLELPALIAPDPVLSGKIKEVHEFVGEAGYYLIGLHAAAALFNHYLLRNDTLKRVLPWNNHRP